MPRKVGPVDAREAPGQQGWIGRGLPTVPEPDEHQEGQRHEQGSQLEPVLEGLHEGDRAHPTGEHVEQDDHGHHQPAGPWRQSRGRSQGYAGALELWHQVEPADHDDQHRGGSTYRPRVEPGLREVGQGVGAGSTQRRGDQREQDQIAGCPADGVPEHLCAVAEHEPGNPQEGRRREVLPTDRGGVEPRSHRPRGHEEVRGGAADPQPPRADHQGGDGDGEHRDQPERQVHVGSSTAWSAAERSITRTNARSLRSARRR